MVCAISAPPPSPPPPPPPIKWAASGQVPRPPQFVAAILPPRPPTSGASNWICFVCSFGDDKLNRKPIALHIWLFVRRLSNNPKVSRPANLIDRLWRCLQVSRTPLALGQSSSPDRDQIEIKMGPLIDTSWRPRTRPPSSPQSWSS